MKKNKSIGKLRRQTERKASRIKKRKGVNVLKSNQSRCGVGLLNGDSEDFEELYGYAVVDAFILKYYPIKKAIQSH